MNDQVQEFGKAHGLDYRELYMSEVVPKLYGAGARVAGVRQKMN